MIEMIKIPPKSRHIIMVHHHQHHEVYTTPSPLTPRIRIQVMVLE